MTTMHAKKPGGNFTEPEYDRQHETVHYNVFVDWEKICECDSDAEATYELHKALEDNGRINVDHS